MAHPGPGASDAKLVEESLAGDRRAFGLLVERHRASVTRVLRAMFGNVVGVEDLVQDSFLRAYLDLERLRDATRFGAWVRSIAVNLARMELRSGRLLFVSWEAGASQVRAQSSPEARTEQREWARRIRQAIATLPPAEREAIREVYLNELSHREAAQELYTSVGAIKVRVHRGRQRLRQELRVEFDAREGQMEATMIEVEVRDVLVKQVEEEARPQIDFSQPPEEQGDAFLLRMKLHRVVVLGEKEGRRVLPIWVGPAEGEAIVLHLQGRALARPITFDLLKEIFSVGRMRLQSVAISRVHENVFFGTLLVQGAGDGMQEVDCRPSDAINLALRMEAPILVAPAVMEQLGVAPEDGDDFLPREEGERWVSLLKS